MRRWQARCLAALLCSLICCFTSPAAGEDERPADAAGADAADAWVTYNTAFVTGGGSEPTVAHVTLARDKLAQYGPSFRDLSVEVTPETASRLHVKVKPTGAPRWEVPDSIVPRPGAQADLKPSSLQYKVPNLAGQKAFALTVARTDGTPIFDTTGQRLVFKDQFIELTTSLPADAHLYGLGETTLPTGLLLPRDGSTLTMWARDISAAVPRANLYGAHPFFLQVNKDGSSHGVLLLNSNAMDVVLQPTALTYKMTGGLIDLYFFMGPTPEAVIQQYHAVIGRPALPPYWALGLHQTKWGYASVGVLAEVLANYSAAGLPLETLWSDIDYQANRFRSMEFDAERYPVDSMRALVEAMHARGQHWMPLVNAGIAAASAYSPYEDGTKEGVWIKDASGADFVGQVWPGMAVFPDYLESPKVAAWLARHLGAFYNAVPFDGLWLDMNEASNFCSGTTCQLDQANSTAMYWSTLRLPSDGNIAETRPMLSVCMLQCGAHETGSRLAHPPYKVANFADGVSRADLSSNVISPTAVHAKGSLEYDAHNLFGTSMALRHHEAVVAITGKRPFMLSRSTFPGAGRFVAHWTGDNAANWENLYWSIAGILNSNMWGIPMVGADICGFIDAADGEADPWNAKRVLPDDEYEQLCTRWASAGAFYPFSRNHMGYPTRSHEFYRWPRVTAAARKAYRLRYKLLTYLYTSLYLAHSRGGTVARPLFFTDPTDLGARNATKQWMLGEAVLVSPVLTKDATTVDAYFTAGLWYNAWNYSKLVVPQGTTLTLDAPLGTVPVHYRGGAVLPLQKAARKANATRDIRFSSLSLIVTLPDKPSSGPIGSTPGPLPPYALHEQCASAHEQYAGKLVSCGVVFMDTEADTPAVEADGCVEVVVIAVTEPDYRSGFVATVVMNAGDGMKDKLKIDEFLIVGVPKFERPNATEAVGGGGGGGAGTPAGAGAEAGLRVSAETAAMGVNPGAADASAVGAADALTYVGGAGGGDDDDDDDDEEDVDGDGAAAGGAGSSGGSGDEGEEDEDMPSNGTWMPEEPPGTLRMANVIWDLTESLAMTWELQDY